MRADAASPADEVIQCGGEQAFGKVVRSARVAEAVDGGGDVRQVERRLRQRVRQDRPNQPDPGQRQVIEGDVEKPILVRSTPRQAFSFLAVRLHRRSSLGRLRHDLSTADWMPVPPRRACHAARSAGARSQSQYWKPRSE